MNAYQMIQNQKRIFDMLKQNKKKNRLSHAYLFYGDEGVGKKEMAYALACLFYCKHDGCLECEDCKAIFEDKHLNVHYIGVMDSKSVISKEQIQDLQEEFSKTSLLEGPRIYIVDGIDTASSSAQNSLLKFIEEPINQTPTIGIFIATELANVVSTIVSRCSLIYFKALEVQQLAKQLKDNGMEELDANLTSVLTNNIYKAEEIRVSQDYSKAKEVFLEFLSLKNKKQATLFFINFTSSFTKEIVPVFFKWLIAFYEDIFKLDDKEDLLLTALYDKIVMYAKTENETLKSQFSLVLDLYARLNCNVSAKNIMHELISKLF